MPPVNRSSPRPYLERSLVLLRLTAVGMLCLLAMQGVLELWAWTAERRFLAYAADTVGPITRAFLEDVPVRSANADARDLELMAGVLGVDLAPRTGERRSVDEWTQARVRELRLGEWVVQAVAREAPGLPPISWELRSYCCDFQEDLRRFAQAAREKSPIWRQDHSIAPLSPISNILGQIHLTRVLAACALVREDEGLADQAEELLQAAWRMNEPLGRRAEQISVLIHLSGMRTLAGVVRRLQAPDPAWSRRFREADPLRAYRHALRGEAHGFYWVPRRSSEVREALGQRGPHPVLRFFLESPPVKALRRRALDHEARRGLEIQVQALEGVPCSFGLPDLDRRYRELEEESWRPVFYGWHFFAVPGFTPGSSVGRVQRALLELEMAARVVELKGFLRREDKGGSGWLSIQELLRREGIGQEGPCPRTRWRYEEVAGGKRIRLWLEGLDESRGGGEELSERFRVPLLQEVRRRP